MTTRWGAVVGQVHAPGPVTLVIDHADDTGLWTGTRRIYGRRLDLTLPAGRHRIDVEDSRALHDPRRHAGTSVDVLVAPGSVVTPDVRLLIGATATGVVEIEGRRARFARVQAASADQVYETRTDGHGVFTFAGLRAGSWRLRAENHRRTAHSADTVVDLATGETARIELDLALPSSRLIARVRGAEGRALSAERVTVVEVRTDRRVTGQIVDGVADIRGLGTGRHRIILPASIGHLGAVVDIDHLAPGQLAVCDVVAPVGASVAGRILQGIPQIAAVVALVDDEGRELERARTEPDGRFVLGTGLRSTAGLTLVATTGPETLHVTRAARAELTLRSGVRHHLGDIELPLGGPIADWTVHTRTVAGMKLPSTRV